MLHTILVPLDGSEQSKTVLGPLRRLLSPGTPRRIAPPGSARHSGRLGPQLILLHVIAAEHGAETELASAQRWLEELRQDLDLHGQGASVRIVRGDPAEAIAACATDLRADLVAMATHGRTGAARLFLGSVAEGVLRRATAPVLLVNPHTLRSASACSPLQRLLLAHDGSDSSSEVAPIVARLARQVDAEVVVGRIVDPTEGSPGALHAHEASLAHAALALGDDVKARGALAFGRRPADALLELAEQERVDLIAMATHGRGGLERALLGSVAETVVRRAVVPVVVKRTR